MRRLGSLLALAMIAAACSTTPDPAPSDVQRASVVPAEDSAPELAGVAWWELQLIGFGVIPEATPDPKPSAQPVGFRELTIGTLDGRVTAVLALHEEWSHSYVSGPYGTDVLVANDTGSGSEVFTIDAVDGSRRDLFWTDAIVPAAAIGDGGRSVYYLELDRGTMESTGLFRRSLAGGPPEVVMAESITERSPEPVVYWVAADPLVNRIIVQWCFGEVQCTTHIVDTTSGAVATRQDLGWPMMASSNVLFANGLGPSDTARALDVEANVLGSVRSARRAVPVLVGSTWAFVRGEGGLPEGRTVLIDPDGTEHPIPGADPEFSELGALGERHGVNLPPGWVLRWPRSQFFTMSDPPPAIGGQLINVASGQRVGLRLPALEVRVAPDCTVLAPSEMPGGEAPGTGILELVDGRRTVTWGSGDNRVVLGIGWDAIDGQIDASETIPFRGTEAQLQPIGDVGVSEVALVVRIDGCDYTVWLAAGTSLEMARDYAARY